MTTFTFIDPKLISEESAPLEFALCNFHDSFFKRFPQNLFAIEIGFARSDTHFVVCKSANIKRIISLIDSYYLNEIKQWSASKSLKETFSILRQVLTKESSYVVQVIYLLNSIQFSQDLEELRQIRIPKWVNLHLFVIENFGSEDLKDLQKKEKEKLKEKEEEKENPNQNPNQNQKEIKLEKESLNENKNVYVEITPNQKVYESNTVGHLLNTPNIYNFDRGSCAYVTLGSYFPKTKKEKEKEREYENKKKDALTKKLRTLFESKFYQKDSHILHLGHQYASINLHPQPTLSLDLTIEKLDGFLGIDGQTGNVIPEVKTLPKYLSIIGFIKTENIIRFPIISQHIILVNSDPNTTQLTKSERLFIASLANGLSSQESAGVIKLSSEIDWYGLVIPLTRKKKEKILILKLLVPSVLPFDSDEKETELKLKALSSNESQLDIKQKFKNKIEIEKENEIKNQKIKSLETSHNPFLKAPSYSLPHEHLMRTFASWDTIKQIIARVIKFSYSLPEYEKDLKLLIKSICQVATIFGLEDLRVYSKKQLISVKEELVQQTSSIINKDKQKSIQILSQIIKELEN
ncbi:stress response protein nst1 [Anaeramoeba flamelloides]|uniref:Stress response protein nst1 n=1 Tax=Anaeramoeba flamelloides TaxID=1746091 RepID=A0ABQ8Y777_9EUKA|nr:stress response protein nst1 [Anaeramoeba flamelloides]